MYLYFMFHLRLYKKIKKNTILHNQMIQDRHVSLLTQPPILRLNQQQWTTTNI